jgi:hypothetical protein
MAYFLKLDWLTFLYWTDKIEVVQYKQTLNIYVIIEDF